MAFSLMKAKEEEKMAQMCTYVEEGREIAFIQIFSWIKHYFIDGLLPPHTSLKKLVLVFPFYR